MVCIAQISEFFFIHRIHERGDGDREKLRRERDCCILKFINSLRKGIHIILTALSLFCDHVYAHIFYKKYFKDMHHTTELNEY